MTQAREPLTFEVLASAAPMLSVVEAVDGDEVVLARAHEHSLPRPRARLALPREQPVLPGDTVVVLRVGDQDLVIASLTRRAAQLRLADGSVAAIDPSAQSLELRGADGALLLQYTVGGQLRVEAEQVTIAAVGGDLTLRAAGQLKLEGQTVAVRGGAAGDAHVSLGASGLALNARSLELQAETAVHRATRLQICSRELQAELGDARVVVSRFESVAGQVVQRAQTLYQRVEALAQQRIGTLRLLVDETLQIRAKSALTRTEETFKVRAEQIHLG